MTRTRRAWRSVAVGTPFFLCAVAELPGANAATGLSVEPSWQARAAKVFAVRDGAIFADGEPFPLNFEFTWSSGFTEPFFRYFSQFLGTVHWESHSLNVGGPLDFSSLDKHYADAAKHHIYCCPGLSVAHAWAYIAKHPEAAMRRADGSPSVEGRASLLDHGYRQALRESLKSLALHVRDLPYHFGYYPQDEYSYGDWGGYEETSLRVFRERLVRKYGDLAGINRAWGSAFGSLDAVIPPKSPENSPAWADFQEHRIYAQCDFAAFVTKALHEFDPNHVVIWSLPFWGSPVCAANWWSWPGGTDVLMRHGIDFSTGAHRMVLLRDIAEATGKVSNALCMPPDYDADYVQMMYLLTAGRTGLSHVCVGGTPEHLYYQGAADSTLGWKRKEPIYTASRNLNALVRYLGPTYLLSKQRTPQVGIYQSERTLALNGIQNRSINGLFLLLDDLNLDYRVFSERGLVRIGELPAVVVGPFSRCFTEAESKALRDYVERGGNLVFVRGAAEADEFNRPAGSPGFGLEDLVGSKHSRETKSVKLTAGDGTLPLSVPVSLREIQNGVQALAKSEDGFAVVTQRKVGNGRVLYIGADLGATYQSGWTPDFAGVNRPDSSVIDTNAFGSWFRPDTAGRQSVAFQGHRAWAVLVRQFLSAAGIRPWVNIEGVSDSLGAVRVKSFRQGQDYWIGFANRVVQKGADHKSSPPDQYHPPFINLRCAVRVDADTAGGTPSAPRGAYLLPMNRLNGEGQSALPEPLRLTMSGADAAFVLPRLEGMAAVLLTSDYEPLVGIASDRYHVLPGDVVHLTGRIINAARKALAANLRVDAAAPLVVLSQPVKVTLKPGAMKDIPLALKVPLDAEPDHLLLQVVADRPSASPRTSPSIELEVQSPVEIKVANTDRTLIASSDPDSSLRISGVARVPAAEVNLRVEIVTPSGFAATPNQFELKPDSAGRIEAEAQLKDNDTTSRVGLGELRITGTVRGRTFERKCPIRLARGAVAYEETLPVKSHAGGEAGPTRLIALENERIKANFIPGSGVLHDLVLRETNTDVLVSGEYPYGMVLYGGWSGGTEVSHGSDGKHAEVRLASVSPDGRPVTMTAGLNSGDDFVRVEYDFHDAAPIKHSFYLMSRISLDGTADVMLIPKKAGEVQRPWGQTGFLSVKAEELSVSYLAVRNSKTGEVFAVAYQAPAFGDLSLSSGANGYNYMLFNPLPNTPPGKAVFLLGTLKGTVEDARRLGERLAGAVSM